MSCDFLVSAHAPMSLSYPPLGQARVRSHAYRVGGVAVSLRMRASFARLRRQHPARMLTGKYVNYFSSKLT